MVFFYKDGTLPCGVSLLIFFYGNYTFYWRCLQADVCLSVNVVIFLYLLFNIHFHFFCTCAYKFIIM